MKTPFNNIAYSGASAPAARTFFAPWRDDRLHSHALPLARSLAGTRVPRTQSKLQPRASDQYTKSPLSLSLARANVVPRVFRVTCRARKNNVAIRFRRARFRVTSPKRAALPYQGYSFLCDARTGRSVFPRESAHRTLYVRMRVCVCAGRFATVCSFVLIHAVGACTQAVARLGSARPVRPHSADAKVPAYSFALKQARNFVGELAPPAVSPRYTKTFRGPV